MSENMWFYENDGKAEGPFPEDMIRGMLGSGLLKRDVLLWTEGESSWVRADQLDKFSSILLSMSKPDVIENQTRNESYNKGSIIFSSSVFRIVGGVIITLSIIGILYFLMKFDTTIHGFHNIGLLQDRQNGIIVSGIFAIFGVVLFFIGEMKK